MTDYLIIGGGSAGCVLGARLSEDASNRVTLVEAGRDLTAETGDPAISSRYPGQAYLDERNIWPRLTARMAEGAADRRYEQGRLLGGGSAINALMSNRGAPGDYDEWEALGAAGWSWASCLPYFRKQERDVDFAGPFHGANGPIPVRRMSEATRSGFARAAFDAFEAAGHARLQDQNERWRDGFFPSAMALSDREERIPVSVAYLTQAVRRRPNLRILTDQLAERIVLEGKRACGAVVVPAAGGDSSLLQAEEVIVSAGALHSPALLMRSGVGPGEALQRLGLDVVLDRAGIGANLMEHPMAAVSAYLPRHARVSDLGEHSDHGTLRFSSGLDGAPEGDMHIAIIARSGWHSVGQRIGSLLTWVNKPYSRGLVSLASPRARDEPDIDFRLLSDPRDMRRLKLGFQLSAEALRSPAMQGAARDPFPSGYSARVAQLAGPGTLNTIQRAVFSLMLDASGPARKRLMTTAVTHGSTLDALMGNDDVLEAHLHASVSGVWHASGTCRMGSADDKLAVTDSAGRVIGLEGLRVCDASIMPTIPRANINMPIVMMAERIADMIRAR